MHYTSSGEESSEVAPGSTKAQTREAAISAGMLARFMREAPLRQRLVGAMSLLLVALCWHYADRTFLLVWLALALALVVVRGELERPYTPPDAFLDARAREAFVRTMRVLYTVQGLIWGSSVLIFLDALPPYARWGCWLIILTMASGALTGFSLVQPIARAYLHAFFVPLAVLTPWIGIKTISHPKSYLVALLFLVPVICWFRLLWNSKSVFQVERAQCELQYDLAQKEQEARAAVALKNRFLATAAHDMRQPVVALSLYAEHLLAHPDTHAELAPKIASATRAANRLFDSLFDLAHLESGQVQLRPRPMDLKDLLAELREQFEPLAQARQIHLRVRCAKGDATVLSDPVCLRRMVSNVLVNAIKYSPPGKRILMTVRRRRKHLRVEVWDQGFGIPSGEIDKVFQEFYRVDRGGSQEIDGMGLGLSIVTRLAQLLHARVSIRSVEGHGTRFTVRLSDALKATAESGHRSAPAMTSDAALTGAH